MQLIEARVYLDLMVSEGQESITIMVRSMEQQQRAHILIHR